MTKEEKRKKLQEWREQKNRDFEESLPMSREHLEGLFDYLDTKLEEGYSHSHQFTLAYLRDHEIAEQPVLDWLRENGGYCDCEVLTNAEDALHSSLGAK